jgi:hypothetical protein
MEDVQVIYLVGILFLMFCVMSSRRDNYSSDGYDGFDGGMEGLDPVRVINKTTPVINRVAGTGRGMITSSVKSINSNLLNVQKLNTLSKPVIKKINPALFGLTRIKSSAPLGKAVATVNKAIIKQNMLKIKSNPRAQQIKMAVIDKKADAKKLMKAKVKPLIKRVIAKKQIVNPKIQQRIMSNIVDHNKYIALKKALQPLTATLPPVRVKINPERELSESQLIGEQIYEQIRMMNGDGYSDDPLTIRQNESSNDQIYRSFTDGNVDGPLMEGMDNDDSIKSFEYNALNRQQHM